MINMKTNDELFIWYIKDVLKIKDYKSEFMDNSLRYEIINSLSFNLFIFRVRFYELIGEILKILRLIK